ncbi:hypothetical protein [Streptomyces sp. NPDC026659]|uniref:hypothetical protein n=1 Tax=Streptomyces sp. NPDC026659 TaxID=3155123 RepID=UPI0033C84122
MSEGDLGTGVLAIDLYNDDAPESTPSMAVLIRRPLNSPSFEPGWVSDPSAYVHHWADARWSWTVALWGRPLTEAEFSRVVSSMPTE